MRHTYACARTHTEDDLQGRCAVLYRQFLDENARHFLKICSPCVKRVRELLVISNACFNTQEVIFSLYKLLMQILSADRRYVVHPVPRYVVHPVPLKPMCKTDAEVVYP
jgi:hypothetical protein